MEVGRMTRAENAANNFYSGYNCSTSVALAFKDLIGKTTDEVVKDMMGFGGGMGHYRITCGAVSGMVYVISNLKAKNTKELSDKQALYDAIYPQIDKFNDLFGATDCKTLLSETHNTFKALERTKKYYEDRPCANIVYQASQILEDYLNESSK